MRPDGRRFTAVGISINNSVRVGLAVANPKDNFARKLGRIIATGRAERNPTFLFPLPIGADSKEFFYGLVPQFNQFVNGIAETTDR